MHDTVWFEIQGKPSVMIASTEFVNAAEAQAQSLGLPDLSRVFVPHPIQDANDEELRAQADEALDQLIAALVD